MQKPGRWCAAHVHVAWQIMISQQKQKKAAVAGGAEQTTALDLQLPATVTSSASAGAAPNRHDHLATASRLTPTHIYALVLHVYS